MTLIELETLASEKLSINNEDRRTSFLRLLSTGLLVNVVDNLLGNERELNEVASRSYCHNNGFLKVVLIDKRPKYSVRFHIWPEESFQAPDVHNHPWDMTGLVLNGSYEWPIYTLDQNSEGCESFDLFECRYLEDYSGHSFHKLDKVVLKKVDKLSFQQGDIFQFPQTQFHSVRKENSQPAESIVITGDSVGLSANVITHRKIMCSSIYKNSSVDSSFLQYKLSSFLERRLS
ncbi:hypothetical protein EXT42_19040 [Pseudoalteromonas sp. CO302Y]|uniref:hypothetical protein n=1 Tax=unclassified Pseudoalteromonas TaxID=194690 RepID=UPI0010236C60|nr:hypothetical protein EXT42_19040 [Pseudoalteromonas sp. CO302Y]RZG06335.1 hypothetical protein EXT40_19045 [Pseudoalteromonas sp. CO133X]